MKDKVLNIVVIILNIVLTFLFVSLLCCLIFNIFENVFFGVLAAILSFPVVQILVKKILKKYTDKVVALILIKIAFIGAVYFLTDLYLQYYTFSTFLAQKYVTEQVNEEHKKEDGYNFINGIIYQEDYYDTDDYIKFYAEVKYSIQNEGKEIEKNETVYGKYNRRDNQFERDNRKINEK